MRRLEGVCWVPLVRFLYERLSKWHVEHTVAALAERFESLQQLPVEMQDGRVLYLDLRNPTSVPYLMLGDFPCEKFETEFVANVVRPGDTVVDIGSNVGWYASLLCELVGPRGKVYAFEPNSNLAVLLNRLGTHFPQLHVEAAGLGNCDGEECFSIPENWISGSFGEVLDAVETEDVPVYRLDSFLDVEETSEVTFIKCDAEGAELGILSGAMDTICQDRPPMWLVEMSSEETAKFDYHPRCLVEFFQQKTHVEYEAFMIDQETGGLKPLVVPAHEPFWFNAVFAPNWLHHRIFDLISDTPSKPRAACPANST